MPCAGHFMQNKNQTNKQTSASLFGTCNAIDFEAFAQMLNYFLLFSCRCSAAREGLCIPAWPEDLCSHCSAPT